MEFLVEIVTELPPDMPETARAALLARERERGAALRDAGTLRRIWRLPGRLANVGIWSVPDADALHEALTSLPVQPYARITVTALAGHPLDSTPAAGDDTA
ncbi:muconolactone delta-isomerase [Streptomyces sp. 150FB]|uniref:muconolactone Delta-isomerase family protein n=1 Tax=Streptomyces sp. 150FB TaxID=1576605 RepID=UPI000589268C|nr:muconolactone Delta-isomerase family protein [Streptomyces sp. 150FB]KIF73115.1 muconolactone delta-isomerase [Streptomyces sp. 150FB]